ncbi:MAG: helicase, superfamily [Acidimicrobiales bacterium]|nr:helicase, superfamily [Acidimicrobiales bacterium]
MSPSFSDLGVAEDLTARLAAHHITTPFPIQADAIPAALAGRDVCGRAPTGSGKTLAFGLPIAQLVRRAGPKRPKALVLAPTRELAGQIHTELAPLLALRGRRAAAIYGGMPFAPQLKLIRKGVDVLIACPGRLADLVNRGDVILDNVEIVVVDEADRMADMGFLPEVRRLLDRVRPDRQTLLFSATLDGDVDVIIRNYQRDPVRCDVAAEQADLDLVQHRFVTTSRDRRLRMTVDLVNEHGATVVFCRTKRGADRVADQLSRAGVAAVAIHGDLSQRQRERALASFAARKVSALVATDVAARGIHVDDVGCVVHYDIPTDAKDYVHRSGRTGRAGAKGVVIALVVEDEHAKARTLQRALGMAVQAAAAAPQRPTSRRPPTAGRPPRARRQSGRPARRSPR